MEMYRGNLNSRFKLIADRIPEILTENGNVISFGYHSTYMGRKRNFYLDTMCIFAHGGAQHCTIAIIEKRKKQPQGFFELDERKLNIKRRRKRNEKSN